MHGSVQSDDDDDYRNENLTPLKSQSKKSSDEKIVRNKVRNNRERKVYLNIFSLGISINLKWLN